ncbi:MAG: hypothetical protein V7K72_12875 [Nostoc sp.]|uniref:hypothetical protein n=1 Tax=Nostoc sp. TaxID=1180 RepID=UPI002FF69C75
MRLLKTSLRLNQEQWERLKKRIDFRFGDWGLGTGDWGLGTGDWGLGIGYWLLILLPHSLISPISPAPQSPAIASARIRSWLLITDNG